MASKWS